MEWLGIPAILLVVVVVVFVRRGSQRTESSQKSTHVPKVTSGGKAVAHSVRAMLEQTSMQSDVDRQLFWQQSTVGYLQIWSEQVQPYLTQGRPRGRDIQRMMNQRSRFQSVREHEPAMSVEEREHKWCRLRKREHDHIWASLQTRDQSELGADDPDCLRALVSFVTTQTAVKSRSTVSWSNEWRFYYEALQEFGLKPYHDVPPSFSGQFPPGWESI